MALRSAAEARPVWVSPSARPEDRWWGVYSRVSAPGETTTEETSVDRQTADGLEEARRRGAQRVRIYEDRGFSAYKRGVRREAFEELLEDIEAVEIVAVVAWRAERLARQPRDAERLMEALGADDDRPRAVAYTIRDGVDTNDEPGKFVFRQLVQFGRWESRAISDRVRRARRAAIEDGRFSGSPPAFGHRDGTQWREIVPEEVALVREGATRAIAGEGVRSILRDFNARGSRTRSGAHWQHRAWIKMVTSPRMIGARMVGDAKYHGTDAEGNSRIGAILDQDTWEQVRTILLDPNRRKHDYGGTPKHLLTGLMRCGATAEGRLCGEPLRAKGQSGRSHGPGYWTYGCVRDAYHTEACGRVWIKGSNTDAYIERVVLAHLRMPSVVSALSLGLGDSEDPTEEASELRRRLMALKERIVTAEVAALKGLSVLEAEFGVSMEGYRVWRAQALAERDDLEKSIARTTRARSVVKAIADPEEFWRQAALDERRDLVRSVLPSIFVRPASSVPGNPRRWNHRRIKLDFIA